MATDRTPGGAAPLFIIEPEGAGNAWLRLAGQCARGLEARAVVIGTACDARRAHAAGVPAASACAPPFRRAALGWRAIVRMCATDPAQEAWVCFGATAAAAGMAAARGTTGARARRVVVLAAAAPHAAEAQLLERAWGSGSGRVSVDVIPVAPVAAVGWPTGRGWVVHAPEAYFPRVAVAQAVDARTAVRRAWGVPASGVVVGLVASPPAAGDAMRALDVVGRFSLLRPGAVLVIHPGAARACDAQRWAEQVAHVGRVMVHEVVGDPWRAAPALDAALVAPARGAAGVPMDALAYAACGVPVVLPEGAALPMLTHAGPQLAYPAGRPTAGAHALDACVRTGASAACAQQAAVAALPDAGALIDRVRSVLAGVQRAA